MNGVFVFSVLVASVLAAPCRHDDHTEWTEARVIDLIVEHMDRDNNNYIINYDIASEFIHSGYPVNMKEFVKGWTETYHDEKALAQHIFQHFDMDNSGVLDYKDIKPLIKRVDTDDDGKVHVNEFKLYLKHIYNAC